MVAMIITHTQSATGERRLYLGGKGSLECYLAPTSDGDGWTFHLEGAVTGNAISESDRKAWAIHILARLADELAIAPADLATVPFEVIAALHTADPYAGRRIPTGRRQALENGFLATRPTITRPKADFTAREFPRDRRTR